MWLVTRTLKVIYLYCSHETSPLMSNTRPRSSVARVSLGTRPSLSLFLILLSVLSYGLSVLSVGETIMFVIFKKNSDDDNLLDRKDEDELEEENDDTTLDFNDESERAYSNASSGHSEEE